jgi:hypothetical protein
MKTKRAVLVLALSCCVALHASTGASQDTAGKKFTFHSPPTVSKKKGKKGGGGSVYDTNAQSPKISYIAVFEPVEIQPPLPPNTPHPDAAFVLAGNTGTAIYVENGIAVCKKLKWVGETADNEWYAYSEVGKKGVYWYFRKQGTASIPSYFEVYREKTAGKLTRHSWTQNSELP